MRASAAMTGDPEARASFDRLLGELRPKLHRYCARMTGSVVDGEDVLQEAIVKAIEAFPGPGKIGNPEGWLFRIAHNAALDFLRRRTRQNAIRSDEDPDIMVDPVSAMSDRQIAAASLRTFMRLPVAQRSSIILMDVLGYSLEEISGIMNSSVAATKAALHRGRACESSRRSPTTFRSPSSPIRIVRCLPPMWTASMRATSMRFATCSPRKCGLSS